MKFLAQELNLDDEELESLLVDLIVDDRIQGRIDQLQGFVALNENELSVDDTSVKKLTAIDSWASALTSAVNNSTIRT